MSPASHQSPNAIPPRRSSSGWHSHTSSTENPTRPALKPVPEASWMASSSHSSLNGVETNHLDPAVISTNPQQNSKYPTTLTPSSAQQLSFDAAASTVIHKHGTTWSLQKEKILMGPYDYMVDHPGKDIRKQLIGAFNAWLKVPAASLGIITKVVGMLHTASLLVDDVEDFSLLRRGVPVAHSIFGTAQTINSANYVYFAALQELVKLGNPKVIKIYTDELCNLHRGQGMDLFWRDTLTCPTEQDYLEMVGNKTGGLFRLAVLLMQAESQSENFNGLLRLTHFYRDYIPLVNTIGLLFQIRDDYMNLASTTYADMKGLCEDLTEGKFSFPIIHSIRSNPNNLQLINILKQKTTDNEVKRYAVKYMEKTGSFEYCRTVLRELEGKALGMVEEIDGGSGSEGGGGEAYGESMD
ncbi:uncharacterized protein KY384_008147 [Bacidia gigantensis]|uniref:uncharacterized protein n=1 Tax=Bacidia gigantensis TaxID=2732470 RepID=UPI001D04630E|nr:uncharacterized protein KY384_008147 [Bacidia gigantensis]KAG8526718.1 hypothetical protein KY384_008147 [Bacidia gigantensis]